ncbi:MAG: SPOR domain-containing protein [bacterium]|nr:SPOR domain-containing protein [bacterium]
MKSLLLFLLCSISLSVCAQTDTTKQLTAIDSLMMSNLDSLAHTPIIQDTTKAKVAKKDSVKQAVIVADTSKKFTATKDSIKPAVVLKDSIQPPAAVKDSIKPVVLSPDSIKPPLAVKDSISPVKPLQDSIKPIVARMDSVAAPPLEKDTVKPMYILVDDSLRYQSIRLSKDSIKYARLDSLTEEQLLAYYLTEPEPAVSSKGSIKGDSLYFVLNPLTIPTTTVNGSTMFREISEEQQVLPDTSKAAMEQQMRPKISIGIGRLGFHGDLNNKQYQPTLGGRPAFDLAISQRLTPFLQLDFNMLFGRIAVNENTAARQANIRTDIRAGGVNLLYDFGNFIPDNYRIRPFVSFGVYGFEFLSKTDLKDKNGNTYFYWSDGSVKDKAEGTADAQYANTLTRDYIYESDVREQNLDGFGKYRESAWSFPIGAGVVMKIHDRIDMKINYQYYLSTTDYIDGITENSVGARKGNKRNDNFSYASISLQYDLIAKKPQRERKLNDTVDFNDAYLMALFNKDSDNDSIIDVNDACQGTPEGVIVDLKGCPLDGDNDGVPDFKDDELQSPQGIGVNLKGVARTDEYWQNWYDQYMNDSLGGDRITEYTGNIYAIAKKKELKKDPFTVELMRYNGAIPSDELAFLLSIGDINSTTLEDGTTVVYTSGNYDKLGKAIKRRDEFREEGNKKAGVSMFKDKDVVQLPEDELESLLKNEIEDLLKLSIGDSNTAVATNPDEAFNKNEIVYRVQLGAFSRKISTSLFGTTTGVLELKTGDKIYKYVTKGYPTIEEAAAVRADLVLQGFNDAFVTAYRGGRRIPMSETKATVDKNYKEDLSEDKTFNSIDKSLLVFKVQLGQLKKKVQEASMDERVKDLKDSEKKITNSGSIRYTSGNFPGLELAEEYRKALEEKGWSDAFVIATFKDELISMQEAMELLK